MVDNSSAVPANGIRRVAAANRLLPVGEYRTVLQHRADRLSHHLAVNRLVAGSNPARGAKLSENR
jgi:hypothetical protein